MAPLTLRQTINERGDPVLATFPVADMDSSFDSRPRIFPHFVFGGGFQRELLLLGLRDQALSGAIVFYQQGGDPFTVTFGTQNDSQFSYRVEPGGAHNFGHPQKKSGTPPFIANLLSRVVSGDVIEHEVEISDAEGPIMQPRAG